MESSTGKMNILDLIGVNTYYGPIQALTDVSLNVKAGEVVALLGANGAGKTTTLNTVFGLLPCTDGEVLFEGQRINRLPPEKIVSLQIGYVPEGRQLLSPMSVADNLLLGAYSRRGRSKKEEIRRDMETVFKLFPILEREKKRAAGTFSGGEQQMLAIGRALMVAPKLLLLDEPSLGLAPLMIAEIMRVIGELRDKGLSILLVEQNAKAALTVADRGYVMEGGHIVMEGSTEQLLADDKVRAAYLGEQL